MKNVVAFWGTIVCANIWFANGGYLLGALWLAFAVAIYFVETLHNAASQTHSEGK